MILRKGTLSTIITFQTPLNLIIIMTHLLFLFLLITVLWIYLRCLLTLEFENKVLPFCPTSLASKSFSELLEHLERWSATSLPHYLKIINSRKCEVCHAKKRGAVWYSWGVILFQMSPPVLAWQNAVLFNPKPPADLNWRLITHFRCVVRGWEGSAWCAGPFVHQGEGLQSGRRFFLQGQAWLTINVLWYLVSHWPSRTMCTDSRLLGRLVCFSLPR